MYEVNQRVWVKSEKVLAEIEERGWIPLFRDGELVGRRAFYVVGWLMEGRGYTLMTGSDNLRAADWCCDGCGRWLPGSPHRTAPDGEYPNGLQFCFLCSAPQVVGYGY